MGRYSYDRWPRYVPVAERRRKAAKKIAKMRKSGRKISPVEIEGRKIAKTFWGDAWCKNLEAYSDYANRMPRGRTYVRNGSVLDLQIDPGRVRSLVSGTSIYKIDVKIAPLPKRQWTEIKRRCGGQIASLVELLMGNISKGVMEIVTRKGEGLFPAPKDISLSCSCPDWATMCKHVAATLYGVGARLDHDPELLFTLRKVDPTEMVEAAVDQPPTGTRRRPRKARAIDPADLSSVFGVDIDTDGVSSDEVPGPARSASKNQRAARTRKKPSAKKPRTKKPVAKKPVAKKPVAKKPVAKKPSAKKPASKKPKTKKPSAKKPASKKPASKKPAFKKPKTKKPKTKKPASKKPASKKPAAKRPAAKRPAAKKPAAKKPAARRPAAKGPASRKPASKKLAAKKPAAKKPAAKKPAAKKKTPKRRSPAKKAGKKPPSSPK